MFTNLREPGVTIDEQIKLIPKNKINIPFLIIPQNVKVYLSEIEYIKSLKVIGACFDKNFTPVIEKTFEEAKKVVQINSTSNRVLKVFSISLVIKYITTSQPTILHWFHIFYINFNKNRSKRSTR